jgi:hypothetical protein
VVVVFSVGLFCSLLLIFAIGDQYLEEKTENHQDKALTGRIKQKERRKGEDRIGLALG